MTIKRTIKFYALCALLLIIVLFVLWQHMRSTTLFSAHIEENKIDITPQQITSIKEIGQWEFLSISEEELVDTTRKGIFSDDHLVRIYKGTLRLGIDLKELSEQNVFIQNDTLFMTLPPIKLLDEHFIDEANTRSFHETGKWKPADRERMYQKAQLMMKQRALTSENYQNAKDYGESQITDLMNNMGFPHVVITFEEASAQ
ncbi:MAG: DUF4230 domain-containing protein [Prevotella sp.]|nr:DUF4230 domain-containing protein [Prevotella sp.]MBP3842307.1 DUF4230 domain-containing protein [Prevotella sp.]